MRAQGLLGAGARHTSRIDDSGIRRKRALVRVTVASATRRVDLALPAEIPVAELIPELARSVGLLGPGTVHGGYRLVTVEGRPLDNQVGLTLQGVRDGSVLTVSASMDDLPPRRYDDVVEAMADAVEQDLESWRPASSRRTALAAAGILLSLGAVSLLLQGDAPLAALGAATLAVALVAVAIVLSRARNEAELAVALAWMGSGYGTVAGLMLATDPDFVGKSMVGGGSGALAIGLMCLVGLGRGRVLMIPPLIVGATSLAVGLLLRLGDFEAAVLLTVVLALLVMTGSIFPWLALGLTGAWVDQQYAPPDITADPVEIDPAQVSADARLAHEILIAISGAAGLLLVLISPLAVSLGFAGTLLAVVAAFVVMLRTRQYRAGSEVLVGLVSGILGLVSVAVSLMVIHPDWRPATAATLAGAGAVLLAATLLPSTPSVRRGRLGDIVESIGLLALLPLLVLATGLFETIMS